MKNSPTLTLRIILADNILNWFLAVALTLQPLQIQALMFKNNTITSMAPILTRFELIALGLCFFAFAAWQVKVFLKPWKLDVDNLRIAAWLAWGPVVLLTIGLLIPSIQLYPVIRALLWIGNLYMLWLGWWYWQVAKKIK